MVDLSVFGKVESLSNLQRQKQALAMKQQMMARTNQPAAIQIAREIERRRQMGDEAGAQLLIDTAKLYDKGFVVGGQQEMPAQPPIQPSGNMSPEQAAQIQALYGEQPPMPAVSVRPGYNEQLAQRNAMMKGAGRQAEQSVNLAYDPAIKQQVVAAESVEKRKQERIGSLEESEAALPQLRDTVERLSELGKKATYTYAGQGADMLRRQTGLPVGDAAVARKEYISLVDNQILPLLRQTFGAQFTQKEGESLKITLGDPNASPEEKDAVLRSFIDQKMQSIQTARRGLGQPAKPVQLKGASDESDPLGLRR